MVTLPIHKKDVCEIVYSVNKILLLSILKLYKTYKLDFYGSLNSGPHLYNTAINREKNQNLSRQTNVISIISTYETVPPTWKLSYHLAKVTEYQQHVLIDISRYKDVSKQYISCYNKPECDVGKSTFFPNLLKLYTISYMGSPGRIPYIRCFNSLELEIIEIYITIW